MLHVYNKSVVVKTREVLIYNISTIYYNLLIISMSSLQALAISRNKTVVPSSSFFRGEGLLKVTHQNESNQNQTEDALRCERSTIEVVINNIGSTMLKVFLRYKCDVSRASGQPTDSDKMTGIFG